MLSKLRQVEQRYIELEEKLQDPEIYSDPSAAAKISREQKRRKILKKHVHFWTRC